MMRDELLRVFPDAAQISDEKLREGVLATWEEAVRAGGWEVEDLERMPFTLLADVNLSFAEHTRTVTRIAMAAYEVLQHSLGERNPLDHDVLLAAGLLHDVGKCLEIERLADGSYARSHSGRILRHPFSGIGLAARHGIPDEVLHVIGAHSKEGDHAPRTPECIVLHHADFIHFELLRQGG
jgi:putative nucleotidyltransferase with HDIG domain